MSESKQQNPDVSAWIKDIESNDKEQEFKPEELPLRKRIFYATMIKTFGNISQSCMVAGISKKTYWSWRYKDPQFRELIDGGDYEDRLLDFAESKLVSKLAEGDIIAILFTLKTRGKKRGYIEGNALPPPPKSNEAPTWFDAPSLPASDSNAKFEEAEVISTTNNGSTEIPVGEVDKKTA